MTRQVNWKPQLSSIIEEPWNVAESFKQMREKAKPPLFNGEGKLKSVLRVTPRKIGPKAVELIGPEAVAINGPEAVAITAIIGPKAVEITGLCPLLVSPSVLTIWRV